MLHRPLLIVAAALGAALIAAPQSYAQDKSIVVASTTSTQDSGLFEYLLPLFTKKTGIIVKVVAQGTGQALDTGRRGDADVVFVHAKSAEEKFLAEGQGVHRYPVMYNDFVLIGPKSDPANIKGMKDVAKAFQTIKNKQASFISRGDRSGTNIAELKWLGEGNGVKRYPVMYNDFVLIGPEADPAHVAGGKDIAAALKTIAAARPPFVSRADKSGTYSAELRLWKAAGVGIASAKGPWYRETGSGMGPALNTAAGMNAYILSDRGTWLNFHNRGDLRIVVQGDKRLFNQYGVMLVNPHKHPNVKKALGQRFIDWLVSARGQAAIASYTIGGEQLFFPNAGTDS